MWLPDELATLYSSRTPRSVFNRLLEKPDRIKEEFARWGRGV